METVKYLTVKQIVEDENYPFTLGQMRHYMMHRHKNGLEHAIRKIDKRIFIRKDLFDKWIESYASKEGG